MEDEGNEKRAVAVLLAGVMTLGLSASCLTGCGSDTGSGGVEKVRLMVWSPTADQSKDNGEWLQTCCEAFADQHPEWDITFVYGVMDEPAHPARWGRIRTPARTCSCILMMVLHG